MPTHRERLRLGYTHTQAKDLRPQEWVHLERFHLQVREVKRSGRTIFVKFEADGREWRWWDENYLLRINYPRQLHRPPAQ